LMSLSRKGMPRPRHAETRNGLIESVNLCSVSAAHRQAIHRFADAIATGM
jgi:hypothetical protein